MKKRFFDFPRHIGSAASTIANTAMLDAKNATADVQNLDKRVTALEAESGGGVLKPIEKEYIDSLT